MADWVALSEAPPEGCFVPRGILTFLRSGYVHGYPTVLTRGQGARVFDSRGRSYLDWVQGKGAVTLGHAHPEVEARAAARGRDGVLFGACPEEYLELARRLAETLPGVGAAAFVKNGSDAIHVALRLCRTFTGRDLVLSAGYHGWDDRLLPGAAPSPVPGAVVDFGYDLGRLEQLLETHGPRVAAVLVTPEPLFFGGEYLRRVEALARAASALFVVDEVRAGMRVAPAGAHALAGVSPDLFTLSKGLANGHPLAAVVGKREVMEASSRTYVFGTYYAEACSLAAALATQEVYAKANVVAAIESAGRALLDGMGALFAELGISAYAVGPAPVLQFLFEDEAAEAAFYQGAVRRGLLFFQNDAQCPSLAHGTEEVAQTLALCREVLLDVLREHPGDRSGTRSEPSQALLERAAKRRMIDSGALDRAAVLSNLVR
ncbi:MAG: aminotransferase class III-fold pyridoxal phosphate-dependent enzyme [Polyangiaceae bacterium]